MKITKKTHILFIALVIVVVFSTGLKNDFAWDDKYLIINNPYVKGWNYLPRIFTTQLYEGGEIHSNFYRPLQLLSFVIDYSIWRLNPFGYHLTSLFLHIANSILIYFILITISSSSGLALLTALLFGISPTISGVTYYISARSDLLMALFIFLSFLFFARYLKYERRTLYVYSLISFILALLSKEMAVILLMFLALEILRSKERETRKWISVLPYALILLFYIALRFSVLNFARDASPLANLSYPASIPLWRRILTDFIIIPKYLSLLLFPYGLHMEWFIEPAKTVFQPRTIFFIFVNTLIIVGIKKISRRDNLVLFGAFWFLSGLLPVLNIYPISVLFGEGWLYVPSVGFFIILSIVFKGRFAGILIILLLIYYSLFTFSYGKVWKDSIALFHNVLKYETESPFVHLTHNNLGMAYFDKGYTDKSIEYCKKSISSNPRYPDAYNNLGVAYMAKGEPVKAIVHFKKAIRLKRNYISAYCNLAHAYSSIGLRDNTVKFSQAALEIDPSSYKAYCNLGYVFSEKGDVDKAIGFFKKAGEIRKESSEPHYCLGSLYIKKERFREALEEYKAALRLGLCDYKFYNELAFLCIKNNKFKEAEGALRQSLALNNNQSEPHNNLGNLYSMFGKLDLAIAEYKKALEVDPDNIEIRDNLIKTEAEWKSHLSRL